MSEDSWKGARGRGSSGAMLQKSLLREISAHCVRACVRLLSSVLKFGAGVRGGNFVFLRVFLWLHAGGSKIPRTLRFDGRHHQRHGEPLV